LEDFAVQFDPLFSSYAQRANFRNYVSGLLLPRDRNKTLTALAGAEPVVQAQAAPVQRLQFFLSESTWDADSINHRRLQLLAADPATAATDQGVLVMDNTGDRKEGHATDHVARQYLGLTLPIADGPRRIMTDRQTRTKAVIHCHVLCSRVLEVLA
jgi:SRSO17 transposase